MDLSNNFLQLTHPYNSTDQTIHICNKFVKKYALHNYYNKIKIFTYI